jgi:RecA-family ATPase
VKDEPDVNDTLRADGPDVARQRHDHARIYNGHAPKTELPPASTSFIVAKLFAWPNPASIPRRQFLYGRHYSRKAVGATIGAGGRAKTTRGLTEAVSMACGRDLFTDEEIATRRVWYLNGEEDQDELDRRLTAICQHHNVSRQQCDDRLFIQSVRDRPIRLATLKRNVPTLNRVALDRIEAEMAAKRIDVLMLDPFISFHAVSENPNEHMDLLLKEGLGGIASRTDAAVEVFHHPGKPHPGQGETAVEDARGASAILAAVRSARVLNFMTPEEATRLGITDDQRRLYIRTANGKANMGPIGKRRLVHAED